MRQRMGAEFTHKLYAYTVSALARPMYCVAAGLVKYSGNLACKLAVFSVLFPYWLHHS